MVKRLARVASRGEVFLVELEPARGSEIKKSLPCIVVSPDELNHHLRTSIVAPMTTGGNRYPFRVPCRFGGKSGHVVLDQLRTVDHERFRKHLGALSPATVHTALQILGEMFTF